MPYTTTPLRRVTPGRAALIAACVAGALTAVAAMSGCRTEGRAEPAGEAGAGGGQGLADAPLDARDQHQLAREIAAAESLPVDEQAARYGEIRASWLGKRYRWKVARVAATCARADRCTVLPFDRAGTDKHIVQGWMPRLDLSPEAYAEIAARCEGAAQCPIEFEGTLSELVVSTEHLTRLAFRDVAIPSPP